MATSIVRARSAALIPVDTPVRASIETAKAGVAGDRFLAGIIGRPSRWIRSLGSARQMSARAWVARKLIRSGLQASPAKTRWPSASSSRSSTRRTTPPSRIAEIARSARSSGFSASSDSECGGGAIPEG